MKHFVIILTLFCITSYAHAELSQNDLDKIRLIVKDEIKESEKRMKDEIKESEKRMKEYVNIKIDALDKRITDTRNLSYALIALVGVVIGIPLWRGRKDDRDQDKINEHLFSEIEAIKQRIQNL